MTVVTRALRRCRTLACERRALPTSPYCDGCLRELLAQAFR
jgi:hypothetical protein